MKTRKAQVSGTPAAAVVLVIAAFILIFIVLIDQKDRDELLGNKNETAVREGEGQEKIGVLLEEQPGTITTLNRREFEQDIPSFNLIVKNEDKTLKEVDSVFIESGGVSSKTVPFFVRDRAENGRLAFSVNDYSGKLTILFNGERIFRGEVNDFLEPLALDKIGEENTLEFSVDSPPGWKFWAENHYDLRNLRITATVENVENREAVNTFLMGRDEIDPENVEDAYLVYLVDCDVSVAGRLTVRLNDRLLSSKVPDCSSLERTDIDPRDFIEGRNELRFSAEKGRYLIDRISVKTRLRNPVFPLYFFDISETQLKKIEDGEINATITLNFIDDDRRKTAVVAVNGRRLALDTRGDWFSRSIDAFVKRGSNSLRIEPDRTLHVTELKVELHCRDEEDCP